jgi:MFS family permease
MGLLKKIKESVGLDLPMNRVISILILSDFFILSGWGLVGPIFAVFITRQIQGAGVEVVGLSSTIYFLLKSGLQLPLANLIDKIQGEKDDFRAMVIGSALTAVVPIFYIFIRNVPQLFVAQALYGIGGALSYPSWLALFTRHIDKNKEGWEWSIYYTVTDLSGAAVAAIGGYLAKYVGFNFLFILVAILNILGTVVLIRMRRDLKQSVLAGILRKGN